MRQRRRAGGRSGRLSPFFPGPPRAKESALRRMGQRAPFRHSPRLYCQKDAMVAHEQAGGARWAGKRARTNSSRRSSARQAADRRGNLVKPGWRVAPKPRMRRNTRDHSRRACVHARWTRCWGRITCWRRDTRCAVRMERDQVPSMILWGPPGSGKTTLASVIAASTHARFVALSAVTAGVADLRRVVEDAAKLLRATGQRTILFIDEIHRFNQVAAGRDPAACRARHRHPDRRDDRESLLRGQRRAALALARLHAARARATRISSSLLRRALADAERGLGAER